MSICISITGKAKYDKLIKDCGIYLPSNFLGHHQEVWKELFEYDQHLQMIPTHKWTQPTYALPDSLSMGEKITLIKYALITQIIGYSFEDEQY